MRKTLLFIPLLCSLTLIGCSKLRLAYENADWLLVYAIKGYVPLERTQKEKLKSHVASYLRWHRKEMLPLYAAFASEIADGFRKGAGPTPEQIDKAFADYHSLYRRTLERTIAPTVELLETLEKGQHDALAANLKEKNQKIKRDQGGTEKEQKEKRFIKFIETVEEWTGKLTKSQLQRIRALNGELPLTAAHRLEFRSAQQNALLTLLRSGAAEESLEQFMESSALHSDDLRSPDYKKTRHEYEAGLKRMILEIGVTLTPEQRVYLLRKIDGLAQDCRKLHKMI